MFVWRSFAAILCHHHDFGKGNGFADAGRVSVDQVGIEIG